MSEQNGVLTRAAPFRASTWDAETQMVEVVLATPGAAVPRWDARGEFDELLDLAGQTCPASVPLLDSHQRGSTDHRLGVVTDIRVQAGDLVGTAKLSRSNERAQRIATDLADGMPYSASIGYSVQSWAETTSNGRRAKTATAFTLLESSFVSIPADPRAGTRSATLTTISNDLIPGQELVSRATINAEIRSLGLKLGLGTTWADAQIDANATTDQARIAATTALEARTAPADTIRPRVVMGADYTDPENIRAAMADALAHRIAPSAVTLSERGRDFRGHSVLDMVADLAAASGERVNLRDREALLQRAVGAHSTSDFPLLLSAAANKALLAQYEIAQPSYRKWAVRKSFADYKSHQFLRVGDIPKFKEIAESGEVHYGTISEQAEKVYAKNYGTGIAISRAALINDDMNALGGFASGFATRAAADENEWAYGVLKANGAMSDGVPLFHANHGNLPTAATFGATGVAASVKALRAQKSLDGLQLNLQPALLVVGPDLEVLARQLLATVNATKTSDVNVWANFAELVVDANLSSLEYYIFASPSAAPTLVYGYVGAAEGPVVRSQVDFYTQAVEVAASLDFGCGIIDFRGAVKNAGA